MTYDTYRIIFYSGIGLAVAGLLVSITLFIVLNIPAVIGELTGRTEKKAIESIRNRNINAQDHKAFDLGKSRKLTGPSRKLEKESNTGGTGKTAATGDMMGLSGKTGKSGKIGKSGRMGLSGKMGDSGKTGLSGKMGEPNATGQDEFGETRPLTADEARTGLLQEEKGTTALAAERIFPETSVLSQETSEFVIEKEITLIHSEEEIIDFVAI